jgi:catechol 2,3-dioxygenase-like lactoylglutathione lyase family enzyme
MNQEAPDLFTRLAPVLNVRDLAAERAFYERLGLPVIYEGPEYPEFIGFGTETVHFGIQKAAADNDPPSVLTWQIGVTSTPPWNDAAPRASASNSNTTPLVLGGPTGGCSSVPQAATGWHSKAPTNSAAAARSPSPGLQFGLQFIAVRPSSPSYARAIRSPVSSGELAPLKL